MIKVCGIYKITSPEFNIYIGQSIDIFQRWSYYFSAKAFGQTKLSRSIIKHGVKNHKFEIIHQCDKHELNHWEQYYMMKYNTVNTHHGLNRVIVRLTPDIIEERNLKKTPVKNKSQNKVNVPAIVKKTNTLNKIKYFIKKYSKEELSIAIEVRVSYIDFILDDANRIILRRIPHFESKMDAYELNKNKNIQCNG